MSPEQVLLHSVLLCNSEQYQLPSTITSTDCGLPGDAIDPLGHLQLIAFLYGIKNVRLCHLPEYLVGSLGCVVMFLAACLFF
jgi:hypothetical protein